MASILDRHAATVMDRLNSGETFQAVCDWLAGHDIRITRQSVHSWYTRKVKKINRRHPSAVITQSTLTRRTGYASPKQPVGFQQALELSKSLDQFIDEGEQLLSTSERSAPRFIARPKQFDALSPAAFSHAFSRLSKGGKK